MCYLACTKQLPTRSLGKSITMIYSSREENTVSLITKFTDQPIGVSGTMMVATNQIQLWSGYSAKKLRPGICSQRVNCTFTEIFQEVMRPDCFPGDETCLCKLLPGAY